MIELRDFMGIGGVLLVQALVALTKKTLPQVPDQYWSGVSVFWGVVLNAFLAYALNLHFEMAIFAGVITGLLASGLYDYSKMRDVITSNLEIKATNRRR